MNILVLGTNSATSAVSRELLKHNKDHTIYHFPANARISRDLNYYPILSPRLARKDHRKNELEEIILENEIDMVFPVSFDYINNWASKIFQDTNIKKFVPNTFIRSLEVYKQKFKKILNFLEIPTPNYTVYDHEELVKDFRSIPRPFVMKINNDYRGGEQTVIVTDENFVDEFEKLKNYSFRFPRAWGEKQNFLIEEYVEGIGEYSYHAICNRKNWQYLGSARDYKKKFEGDKGGNTSGMGAYTFTDVDPIVHSYADKLYNYFKSIGQTYVGIMYLGIMITKEGVPIVLELNTRFGDPEAQVIIPRIENFSDMFYNAALHRQIPPAIKDDLVSVSIKIVEKDDDLLEEKVPPVLRPIPHHFEIDYFSWDIYMFCTITYTDSDISVCSDKIYNFLDKIDIGDFCYRKDIGYFK